MSKPKIDRDNMPGYVSATLLDTIFVTVKGEDDDAFLLAYASLVNAVGDNDTDGTFVATYQLVRVERHALKQTTKVVKVKS